MNQLLKKSFDLSDFDVNKFMTDYTLKEILEWNKDTCPYDYIWAKLQKPGVYQNFYDFYLKQRFVGWKHWSKIEDLSTRELKEVCLHNAYYLCSAMGVSPSDLPADCKKAPEGILYYLVWSELKKRKIMSADEMKMFLMENSYPDQDVTKLRPFLSIADHPLWSRKDILYITGADAQEKCPFANPIHVLRERVSMDNIIVKNLDGSFEFPSVSTDLGKHLARLVYSGGKA